MLVIGIVAVAGSLNLLASGRAGAQNASGTPTEQSAVMRGQEVFAARCTNCHGEGARGTEDGPSLIGVGAASVDFMMRTGRMPLQDPKARLEHGPQLVTDAEREALIAWVTSLAPDEGAPIPNVDGYEDADLARGLALFTTNCAACHGPTAAGIAVGQDDVSSALDIASPLEIAEAVRSGPGVMPVFGEEAIDQEELEALTAWVVDLRDRAAPGGVSIGRSGPVSEGLIAWVLGIGLLMIVMYLLGEKAGDDDDAEA